MTTLIQTAVTTTGALEDSPARIILRTEAPADLKKLDSVQPGDQRGYYRGYYDGPCLILEKVPDPLTEASPATRETEDRKQAIAKLAGMPRADMKTIAAEHGVAWDEKASKQTMAQRIADAQAAPAQI